MYWMVREDGGFEVLDGQQRTISIGQYVVGDFSLDDRFFHNLTKEEQEQILDYELMIYFCEGTDKERLALIKNFVMLFIPALGFPMQNSNSVRQTVLHICLQMMEVLF